MRQCHEVFGGFCLGKFLGQIDGIVIRADVIGFTGFKDSYLAHTLPSLIRHMHCTPLNLRRIDYETALTVQPLHIQLHTLFDGFETVIAANGA